MGENIFLSLLSKKSDFNMLHILKPESRTFVRRSLKPESRIHTKCNASANAASDHGCWNNKMLPSLDESFTVDNVFMRTLCVAHWHLHMKPEKEGNHPFTFSCFVMMLVLTLHNIWKHLHTYEYEIFVQKSF